MDDVSLLQAYADRGDQDAFAQLVRRHGDWLYSAARRQLGDAHLAEDVTQAVFLLLARRADRLRRYAYLGGWLFIALGYCIRQTRERQAATRRREQEAATMRPESVQEASWDEVAPLLEKAVGRLGKADRDVVLLRFYEQKPLAEVGQLMGSSEEAAKKRVQRAVEKLRGMLEKQGVTGTSAGLSAVLVGSVVQEVPGRLVEGVMSAIGGGGSGAASGIAKGAMKMMSLATVKAVTGMGVLLLTAAALPIALAQVSSSSSGTAALKAATSPASTQSSQAQVDRRGSTNEQDLVEGKLRLVGTAVMVYAVSHDGLLPSSLGETLALVDEGIPVSSRAKMFLTPRDEQRIKVPDAATPDWVNRNTSYVYLAEGGNVVENKIPYAFGTILMHTKLDEPLPDPKLGKAVVVAYVDGHVERLALEQAKRVTEESKKTLAAARVTRRTGDE